MKNLINFDGALWKVNNTFHIKGKVVIIKKGGKSIKMKVGRRKKGKEVRWFYG
jgi:hypothetical protein